MGDIVLLTMLQTDLPSDQIGKAYSLLMIVENVGGSLGLLIAVPFFVLVNISLGIALSAGLLLLTGIAGLLRFGLREPEAAVAKSEQRV